MLHQPSDNALPLPGRETQPNGAFSIVKWLPGLQSTSYTFGSAYCTKPAVVKIRVRTSLSLPRPLTSLPLCRTSRPPALFVVSTTRLPARMARCWLAFRKPCHLVLPSACSDTQESSLARTRMTNVLGFGVGEGRTTGGAGIGFSSTTGIGVAVGTATAVADNGVGAGVDAADTDTCCAADNGVGAGVDSAGIGTDGAADNGVGAGVDAAGIGTGGAADNGVGTGVDAAGTAIGGAFSERRALPLIAHTAASTPTNATTARIIDTGERCGFSSRLGFSCTSRGN